jgi:hypothetical protein
MEKDETVGFKRNITLSTLHANKKQIILEQFNQFFEEMFYNIERNY